MPHLRRQPNPRNPVPSQDPNTTPDLRAQYHTPPTRHPIPNPSTGPDAFTPEAAQAGHPAARIDPFGVFGRSPAEIRALAMDDDFDDDYDPRVGGMAEPEDDEPPSPDDSFDVDQTTEGQFDDSDLDEQQEDGDDVYEEDGDEEMQDRGTDPSPRNAPHINQPAKTSTNTCKEKSATPLPPNLREISSLASWTVSTSKPGCGVAALRNTSPSQYWQSDGPQPHTLTLHFFKLVAVVRVRVYLDFELDESYTPTKMAFAAGMGGNDLVEFATWEGEAPCGWVDIPLEGVGGRNGGWVREGNSRARNRVVYRNCEDPRHEHDEECEPVDEDSEDEDPYSGNVLKAMVIQMRIMENHQNGKDTHVRGFQVFACDDSRRKMGNAPSASADDRRRPHHDLRGMVNEDVEAGLPVGLEEPDWMGEPVIR
ncbi:unnamed protein product [Penicillium salamii]|nr:unnamed protein product [Penicillium salamii]